MGHLRIESYEERIQDAIDDGSAQLEALKVCGCLDCRVRRGELLTALCILRGMKFASVDRSKSRITLQRPAARGGRKKARTA